MSVEPSIFYSEPAATAGQIDRAPSSSALAMPARNGVNHLLGNILGGMKYSCWSYWGHPTIRFRTVRHPNADYMDFVLALVDNPAEDETNKDVVITVGTGSAITITSSSPTIYENSVDIGFYFVRAPYGASDSGDIEVTVTHESEVSIVGCWAWDCPRMTPGQALSAGEYYVEGISTSGSGRIGIAEGQAIADSLLGGPTGLVNSVNNSWNLYYPQLMSFSSEYLITSSAAYDNLLEDDFIFCGRNRQKTDESAFPSRWWVYSKCDSGCTYDLRIACSGGNVAKTGLTNTSYAWTADTDLDDLDILTGSYDTLEIAARKTAGTGGVYVKAVSGVGKIA